MPYNNDKLAKFMQAIDQLPEDEKTAIRAKTKSWRRPERQYLLTVMVATLIGLFILYVFTKFI